MLMISEQILIFSILFGTYYVSGSLLATAVLGFTENSLCLQRPLILAVVEMCALKVANAMG